MIKIEKIKYFDFGIQSYDLIMEKYKVTIDPSTNTKTVRKRSNKTKNVKHANFGSKSVQREIF